MKWLLTFEHFAIGLLLLAMTTLAVVQVVTRYVLELPLPWIEEMTRYLMIWMIFIGTALAISKKAHLKVELLELLISREKFRYVEIFLNCLVCVLSMAFTVIVYGFLKNQLNNGQVSPAMQIPMAWPITALLVGGVLMAVQAAHLVYRQALNRADADDVEGGA